MENKQQDMLRKVRALLAKADNTPFEAEADTFRAKAQELMDAYAISEWQLRQEGSDQAAKPVQRLVDFSWWVSSPDEFANQLAALFRAVYSHSNCVTSWDLIDWGPARWDNTSKSYEHLEAKVAVFGLQADLDFADLLFTSLMMQMGGQLKPKQDPNLSDGENIRIAKEAGMKWAEIAEWMGMGNRVRTDTMGRKSVDGWFKKTYVNYMAENGLQPLVGNDPRRYQASFADGFVYTVRNRLYEMRKQPTGNNSSMALALRDAKEIAQQAMYDAHPELAPHDRDCQCKRCRDRRKPVKASERRTDWTAMAAGSQAGERADIKGREPGLKGRKSINK